MKSALAVLLALLPGTALSETNSWSLSSLNGACTITVSRDEDGQLTYGVWPGKDSKTIK